MDVFAFTLVLTAAFVHASWNFLAKRTGGELLFLWLFACISCIIYLPVLIIFAVIYSPDFHAIDLLFILGSSTLHLVYLVMLQRGYRSGDLSVVYPMARGTGPALSTIAAILILGENPGHFALIGVAFIIMGVIILTVSGKNVSREKFRQSIIFGFITGAIIATYTIWDSYSVSEALVQPLFIEYGSAFFRMVLLAPIVYKYKDKVMKEWHSHRFEIIAVAILNPLAYILVLSAYKLAPVSYVAPLRELSTLFAVLMGALILKEGNLIKRLPAACSIIIGVFFLVKC